MIKTLYIRIYYSEQNAYHLNLLKTIIIYIYTIVLPISWSVYTAKLQRIYGEPLVLPGPFPLRVAPMDMEFVVACAFVASIPSI